MVDILKIYKIVLKWYHTVRSLLCFKLKSDKLPSNFVLLNTVHSDLVIEFRDFERGD